MKKVFIKITEIDDVNKFVQYAKNVRGDVLVSRGQFCIDGKSILGIYSLDVSQGCTVQYPENEKEFDNFIQQFMGE
jgi:phosphotransferase system HPr-like phosphotransfer protein